MMFWNVAKVPNFVKYGNRCALHDTFCWLKMGYFRAYFGVYLADPLMLLLNLLTYENFKNKGRSRKMSSVTFENDFFGSLLDMAESHIDVHTVRIIMTAYSPNVSRRSVRCLSQRGRFGGREPGSPSINQNHTTTIMKISD